MKCTSCGGEGLEQGFIPDFSAAMTWVGLWMPGTPTTNKTFWERIRSGGGVDITPDSALAVEAHRCPACGHLELFAREAPSPGTTIAG